MPSAKILVLKASRMVSVISSLAPKVVTTAWWKSLTRPRLLKLLHPLMELLPLMD